jgi:hypothetical protein
MIARIFQEADAAEVDRLMEDTFLAFRLVVALCPGKDVTVTRKVFGILCQFLSCNTTSEAIDVRYRSRVTFRSSRGAFY